MRDGVYVLDTDSELRFVDYRVGGGEALPEQNWTGRQLSYLVGTDTLSPTECPRFGTVLIASVMTEPIR